MSPKCKHKTLTLTDRTIALSDMSPAMVHVGGHHFSVDSCMGSHSLSLSLPNDAWPCRDIGEFYFTNADENVELSDQTANRRPDITQARWFATVAKVAINKALIAEGGFPTGDRLCALLDELDTFNLVYPNAEQPALADSTTDHAANHEAKLGQAYQIIGELLGIIDEHKVLAEEEGEKLLDYFSDPNAYDENMLPWPAAKTNTSTSEDIDA